MFSKRSNQQKARRSGLVKSNLMRGLMSVGVMYSGAQAMTIKDWVVEKNLAQTNAKYDRTHDPMSFAETSSEEFQIRQMAKSIQALVQMKSEQQATEAAAGTATTTTTTSPTNEATATVTATESKATDEEYIQIVKQLVGMVDSLPDLKSCIGDMQAGTYQPTDAAILASGGAVEKATDPATGDPVKVLVNSTNDIITDTTTLQKEDGTTIEVTNATEPASDEAPAEEDAPEEKPVETDEKPAEGEEEEGRGGVLGFLTSPWSIFS